MVIALVAVVLAGAGEPAPARFDAQGRAIAPLAERVADYAIDARLDPDTGVVEGRERITWRNRSAEQQKVLWFHLYWNAFRNERSAWLREARRHRGPGAEPRRERDFGTSEIRSVKAGGADVTASVAFRHPEEATAASLGMPVPPLPPGEPEDRTVFTVELPAPVAPGATVTLELAWWARTPAIVARTGRLGDWFLMGQWFPKIGVLEPAGERGAVRPRWNCHAFWHHAEFYADFGSYDVTLTLPAGMVVGATGALVERRELPGGLAAWRFHQDDVHDFAWTAWRGYRVAEETFREAGLPEVRIRLLYHPEHERSRPQVFEAVRAALSLYGRRFTPYPWAQLTVVDPPVAASEAAGMEYPTFIVGWARRHPAEPRDYLTWMVAVHELGHNLWQGLVASNEFEEPWLDEGLTQYAAGLVLDAHDVRPRASDLVAPAIRWLLPGLADLSLSDRELARGALRGDFSSPVPTPSWAFRGGSDYSATAYVRPQLWLATLERLEGEATARALRGYTERWAFRHPRGEDLRAALDRELPPEVAATGRALFAGTERLDYAVEPIACRAEDDARLGGLHGEGEARRFVDAGAARGEPAGNRCRVTVLRRGGARAPVELEVTFDDGTVKIERWPLAEQPEDGPRWRRFEYLGASKVRQARIDPGHALLLDERRADDSATREPDRRVSSRFLGWLAFALQSALSLLSGLL